MINRPLAASELGLALPVTAGVLKHVHTCSCACTLQVFKRMHAGSSLLKALLLLLSRPCFKLRGIVRARGLGAAVHRKLGLSSVRACVLQWQQSSCPDTGPIGFGRLDMSDPIQTLARVMQSQWTPCMRPDDENNYSKNQSATQCRRRVELLEHTGVLFNVGPPP